MDINWDERDAGEPGLADGGLWDQHRPLLALARHSADGLSGYCESDLVATRPGYSDAVGELHQRLGETMGLVRALNDQVTDLKASSLRNQEELRVSTARLQDMISTELRSVRGEAKQLDQVVTGRLEVLARQVGTIESSVSELQKLKDPLEKLVGLKDKLFAYASVGMVIIFLLWGLVGPFFRLLLDKIAKNVIGS